VKRVIVISGLLAFFGIGGALAYHAASLDRNYRALLVAGDAALARDQTFEAVEAYSGAIALRPDSMLAHLRRGATYRRRGDLEAAARDFRRAATLDPTATRPLEALGEVLYDRERFQAAADTYAERLRLDDSSFPVTYRMALARYRSGDIEGAVAGVTQAIRLNEQSPDAHYLLGLCQTETGNLEQAVGSFERAAFISPGMVPAREELAILYKRLNRRDDELEELQLIAGLDRGNTRRLVELGLAQARTGQTELAVLTLGQALERAPADATVYSALGRVWLDTATSRNSEITPEERRAALRKAVEALERVAPGNDATSEVMTLYGRALLRNNQPEEAEIVLQQATRRYPVDPAAFLAYASAAERQGHLEAARGALIEYGALVADEPDFLARARHIGTLSLRLNDAPAAVAWLERASALRADDVGLLADLARAQIRAGDKAGARATIGRALARTPESPELLDLARRAE
jgi:Flp pilus assembly protein TadD